MRTNLLRFALAASCTLALTACSTGGDIPEPTRDALAGRVGALVDASNTGDFAAARTSLAALRGDVSDARRLGSLPSDRADALLRLADGVEAGLPVAVRPSEAPTRAPVAQQPSQAPRSQEPQAPRSQAPSTPAPRSQAPSPSPRSQAPRSQAPAPDRERGKDKEQDRDREDGGGKDD